MTNEPGTRAPTDVFEAVRTLLAVRSYRDTAVPDTVVQRILEAGRLTGSGILAHELGHAVLQHDLPIVLGGQRREASAYRRAEQQREIDANRKAVEIMTEVVGLPEREAMHKMAAFLIAANASRGGRAIALPHAHLPPCDQFDKLIGGFPQEWSADLSCKKQEEPYRGPLVGTDADLKLTR